MPRLGENSSYAAFIGIDLAWPDRNLSGVTLLRMDLRKSNLSLSEPPCCLQHDDEILDWVERQRGPLTVLGIDAPIIAPNRAGAARPCDVEITRDFGRFHAGAFPANRTKCARPIGLREKLERRAFDSDPKAPPGQQGCWQLEVYPHPAQVVFFRLLKIIKYKKGRVSARRDGLARFAGHISHDLSRSEPRLLVNGQLHDLCCIDDLLRGRRLKARKDQLDAVLCAYVTAYHWWWGRERSKVYGDNTRGYIVCPRLNSGADT